MGGIAVVSGFVNLCGYCLVYCLIYYIGPDLGAVGVDVHVAADGGFHDFVEAPMATR